MKYNVYIPAQEIEIEAESEEEALEEALERCEQEACVEEIIDEKMPEKNMSDEYYIDLVALGYGPFPNQYMIINHLHCFTDGHRIYTIDGFYNDKYKEADPGALFVKQRLSENYLSEEILADTNISVQIDVKALEEKLSEAKYKDQEHYTITANGITKVVNARYLLEAIYFTGSNICRINKKPGTMVHLGLLKNKFAGILPLTNNQ